MSDYRVCDVCGGKAFYDANLNYDDGRSEWHKDDPAYRVVGQEQFADADMVKKYGYRLDYVGDWAVICTDCSPKWKTKIVPIDAV